MGDSGVYNIMIFYDNLLIEFHSRIFNDEHLVISPYARNRFYASQEFIWSSQHAFYLPKASPIKASIKYNRLYRVAALP